MQKIDLSKRAEDIVKDHPDALYSIGGYMYYFPQCCSTGTLQNLTASYLSKTPQSFNNPSPSLNTRVNRNGYKYVFQLIREASRRPRYIFPYHFARHYAMSLVYAKVAEGIDDAERDGYGKYRAAQIVMFDRLLEDKDPAKGFKFQYNMVYSIDQFQNWLSQQRGKYGEVLLSIPMPGGHGARVRGCIFTPSIGSLEKYEQEAYEEVQEHFAECEKYIEEKAAPTVSSAAMKIAY